jgi:hypothetical protein
MADPDLDTKPSKNPFHRYPVVAYRIEQGTYSEERFIVVEVDLTKDDLGPLTPPREMSEAEAHARLVALGLSTKDIEARLGWARQWMATRVLNPGDQPVMWLPPL